MLLIAGAVYLLGIFSLFFGPSLRKWIWAGGSLLFFILLLSIVLLTQFSLFSQAEKLMITNYSSRSGVLYLLQQGQERERIRYELAVNANEESYLPVAEEERGFHGVLLLSKNEIFTVPLQQLKDGQLDIWGKELEPAGGHYRALLQDWQQRQQMYSLAIGLMLFWLLLYFIYLHIEKRKKRITRSGRRTSLPAGEL